MRILVRDARLSGVIEGAVTRVVDSIGEPADYEHVADFMLDKQKYPGVCVVAVFSPNDSLPLVVRAVMQARNPKQAKQTRCAS